MSMSVLVVGGAGYIGSHMVKMLLESGHAVTVFDNLSKGHRDAVSGADFVKGDLLNPEELKELLRECSIDVVMHYAALCYVGESVNEPRRYYRNNVVGSLNLLDAMGEAGIGRLVFSSTCATYGVPHETPIMESHPQNPVNPYGWSKLLIERALQDYAKAYGMKSVSLRYFNAAGSDPQGLLGERHDPETHLIPNALLEARRVLRGGKLDDTQLVIHGTDYETRDGTCIRDYIHVDDLASAHLAAAARLMAGQVAGAEAYNLGNGDGFSVKEVIEASRRVSGVSIGHRVGPRRAGDPPQLVGSASKARDTLGWRPRYTGLDEIIGTAWKWFGREERPVRSDRPQAADQRSIIP
jgi:UDP-glucose 4-epimerase